jgi:hypothetical protein
MAKKPPSERGEAGGTRLTRQVTVTRESKKDLVFHLEIQGSN